MSNVQCLGSWFLYFGSYVLYLGSWLFCPVECYFCLMADPALGIIACEAGGAGVTAV